MRGARLGFWSHVARCRMIGLRSALPDSLRRPAGILDGPSVSGQRADGDDPAGTSVNARTVAYLAAALCGVAVPGSGQESQSLTGRVVDALTAEPVAGAVVAVETANGQAVAQQGSAAISGVDGTFVLRSIPEGVLSVRVEHVAYGVHRQDLRVEGAGTGGVEIRLSVVAIQLEPLLVSGDPAAAGDGAGSARNVIGRPAIEEALLSGADLTDLLRRNIAGITVSGGVTDASGLTCIEFRGARRGPSLCRPPAVLLDGVPLADPLAVLSTFDVSDLQEIRVVTPAEAGTRYGTIAGWGVVLLTSRRAASLTARLPVVQRSMPPELRFEWNEANEGSAYPWLKVYGAAFAGNAVGLAGSAVLLSQCIDLDTRRILRGDEYCGVLPMLGAGLTTMVLPPLVASLSARRAGTTDFSRGVLGRSIMLSLPAMVPTLALATTDAGSSDLTGLEITGLVLAIVAAPALNTLADRHFRARR